MIKTVGIVANPTKNNWLAVTNRMISFLRKKKIRVIMEPEFLNQHPVKGAEAEKSFEKADMVVSLGGDGTLLSVIRSLKDLNIPVFGVNLGGLGFLTEFTLDNAYKELDKVLKNNYQVHKRMVLQANIISNGNKPVKHIALNDVVLSQRDLARLLTINTYINDEYVTAYEADGLIISTPTGSTAYSMSAGGPIVEPIVDAILITPICPHTLTNRPVLVPSDSIIKIELPHVENEVVLTIDGQVGVPLKKGDFIVVKRHAKSVRLIKSSESSFFKILRQKLGWSGSKGFDKL